MKWLYWALTASLILNVIQWITESNNIVTNSEVTKRIESLEDSVRFYKTKVVVVSAERDTAISIMLKSLTNTKPIKIKHDKIRESILTAPPDSQAILFSKRFSPAPNR